VTNVRQAIDFDIADVFVARALHAYLTPGSRIVGINMKRNRKSIRILIMAACSAMTRRYRQQRADAVLRRCRTERLQRLVAGLRVKSWSTRTKTHSPRLTKKVASDGCASGAPNFQLPDRSGMALRADDGPVHNAPEALLISKTQKLPRVHSLFEDPFLPDFEDFVLKFCHSD